MNKSIGTILHQRMDCLGIDISTLSEKSLVDKNELSDIVNGQKCISEIDSLDLEFISQVLYCTPDYFKDRNVRNKDIIDLSFNSQYDIKTNIIKAKLQQFVNDFQFLRSILN